ncbi:hypothetical protein [Curtobacterium herbarum]|uniref:Lipoprotein n=1 Tax=Curtobacterium herbarum TaxID=150122 RepID=A0ABN1Z8J1_9MICO|nr:hypothetical protein [Curtobacterium herbarum]MBM7476459.1 hypothetical protein [Curtobacterium herbarum]MCS6543976.1 hypothetical protein [Curtobacterium herbarum]
MLRRVVPVLALVCGATLALTGCGAQNPTGQVSVTVSQNAADHPYQVKVFLPNGEPSSHQQVYPGDTADFAGVPLGEVTVRAGDLCPERTRVRADQVAKVTLTTVGC